MSGSQDVEEEVCRNDADAERAQPADLRCNGSRSAGSWRDRCGQQSFWDGAVDDISWLEGASGRSTQRGRVSNSPSGRRSQKPEPEGPSSDGRFGISGGTCHERRSGISASVDLDEPVSFGRAAPADGSCRERADRRETLAKSGLQLASQSENQRREEAAPRPQRAIRTHQPTCDPSPTCWPAGHFRGRQPHGRWSSSRYGGVSAATRRAPWQQGHTRDKLRAEVRSAADGVGGSARRTPRPPGGEGRSSSRSAGRDGKEDASAARRIPGRPRHKRREGIYSSPSRGAPWMSRGLRKEGPLKRRTLAWSMRRSAIATACSGEARNSPQRLNGRFVTTIVER